MQRYRSAVAVFMLMLGLVFGSSATPAAAADIGFRDFQFGSSCNSTPTGEKPESKLWWNDGIWWGSLCATDNHYHIFRLNLANQTWVDTGTMLDDRPTTKADTLWDDTNKKLYVASHVFTTSGAPTSTQSSWGRLYRYSYNAGNYTLDPGFPVTVTTGKSETMVLARASNGTLWVTYVESKKVMINHSSGSDTNWVTPFALPVTGASNLSSDDISANIAFDTKTASPKIGVLWSNQNDKKMYFAVHVDSNSNDQTWTSFGIFVPSSQNPAAADDHINIKVQSDGVGVYAVTKTSNSTSSAPLIVLHSCTGNCASASSWQATTVYTRGDNHTRAILLIDTSHSMLNIFSTTPESGGNIYRKTTPINNIAFSAGHGALFIQTAGDTQINNPTSTKQNVNSTTGLVVLASDQGSRRYVHNYDPLGSGPPPPPTADFSGSPTSGTAPLTVNFSDLSSGNPTSWAWDFDNNGVTDSTVQNPTFIYNAPGTYTVKLTATNTNGSNTKTRTNYITVNPTGGTGIKDITFENGSLTDPTNGADSTSGTVTLVTGGQQLKGTYSAQIPNTASSYLQENFTAADDIYVSFYLRVSTLPGSSVRIAMFSNAGTTVGSIQLMSDGRLQLRNGSTTIGSSSTALAVNTIYHIGLHQKKGAGGNAILQAYLAANGDPFGAPFATTATGTWTTPADRLRVGATAANAIAATFDDINLDTAGLPFP
jgi:PKD repeat protein